MPASSAYSSNRSSLEPSSNPGSPSPSPRATPPSDPPKKRTRASKPKVRTGCITWIRRVKCDEGKPACLRCTSTGRLCDGYDNAALARYRSPDSTPAAALARPEFARPSEWNEALRPGRLLEADMDGTETERRVFARFRAATADGRSAHLCSFAAFWRRLTPSACSQDAAVKHAVVALAAAHQLSQHPDEPTLDGFGRDDLELFTIQQYNKSIEQLQRHAGSPSPSEGMRVTLVCCLAFVSLETLRGNHGVAVTHLVNGLRILQSLPDSAFDCLANGAAFAWPPAGDALDMPGIIRLFAGLELSACFFTQGVQAAISSRAYRARRFDDASTEAPFVDVSHARRAMCCFRHDAMARMHEIAAATAGGDAAAAAAAAIFWSDPVQQRQQACLLARCARLGALVADFFSPSRFGAPDPLTPGLQSVYLDLLYFYCAQFLVSCVSADYPGRRAPSQQGLASATHQYPPWALAPALSTAVTGALITPDTAYHLLPAILHLASRLSASASAGTISAAAAPAATTTTALLPTTNDHRHRPLSDIHTRLIGPLYLVALHAPGDNPALRSAAVRLLTTTIIASLCRNRCDRWSGANRRGSSSIDSNSRADPTRHDRQQGGPIGLDGLAAVVAAAVERAIRSEAAEPQQPEEGEEADMQRSHNNDNASDSKNTTQTTTIPSRGRNDRPWNGGGTIPTTTTTTTIFSATSSSTSTSAFSSSPPLLPTPLPFPPGTAPGMPTGMPTGTPSAISPRTPRALIGAGCVPALWDALASAGVLSVGGEGP